METLKEVFANIDFHLNAQNKRLSIMFGESSITLWIGEDGRVHLDTNLVLDGATVKSLKPASN